MSNTKENILFAALSLFAQKGYEAVSTSEIAVEIGMSKAALYKHYKNKRDIFDNIVARMEEIDQERMKELAIPKGVSTEREEDVISVVNKMIEYGRAQFDFWTKNAYAASFRKLLTLEQYRDEEAGRLYQKYFGSGPLGYLTDVLNSLGYEEAKKIALDFYGPMYFLYSLFDGASDKKAVSFLMEAHLREMFSYLYGEENE